MGNRANIAIKQPVMSQEGEPVFIYLYTHWNGAVLPQILQSALKRGMSRWGDAPYLTRIIFSEMVKDDVMGETGAGISTYITDNSHAIIVVDIEREIIQIANQFWQFSVYIETNLEEALINY